MLAGSQKLFETFDEFNDRKAYIQVVLSKAQNSWMIMRIEVLLSSVPMQWDETKWVYETFALIRTTLDGRALAQFFGDALRGETQMSICGIDATIPKFRSDTQGSWRPSMARRASKPLAWPTVDWTLYAESSADSSWLSARFLAAEGCPTFVSVQEALDMFHSGRFSVGNSIPLNDFGVIRVVQEHAWIHKIMVGTTGIDVWIEGVAIENTTVQLVSDSGFTPKKVGSSGRVQFSLERGLEDDARLFLTSGFDCLDYRVLGFQYPYSEDARHGVEYEVLEDSLSEVSRLVTQGEGLMLEYKSKLPSDMTAKWKVMRTVVAFANGNGGEIVFGIEPDELTIIGLPELDEQGERDRLTQMARDYVSPGPMIDVRSLRYEGKLLMAMRVAPGMQRPYACVDRSRAAEFFVRRGATTVRARPDELRQAMLG